MKRFLLLSSVLAAAALALAPGASARIVELGATATPANPSCPADPCVAVVRVTGYQGRAADGPKNPYYIRRNGYIVAFTLNLSAPSAEQVTFFNDNYGSPAQVQLSVLRKGDTRKTRLQHRLVQQSEPFEVDEYFGSSPTFVLPEPLRVREGNWIAVTVPTWAPMLAINAKPAPVRDGGPPSGQRVRVHVQRRQAPVLGHLHPGQSPDRGGGRRVAKPGSFAG